MRRLRDTLLTLLIPTAILVNLFCAPYTKVEESFNIQATHDILTYGIPWKNADTELKQHYDHLTFSGSVPRTFVGSLWLAGTSFPFISLAERWSLPLWWHQIIVRAVLGIFNAICMISFRKGVARSFGRNAANFYSIFQASQFHLMFYASRTLPNFFAFGLTTLALRALLPRAGRNPRSRSSTNRYEAALSLLTFAGIVFRSEIAVLLACHVIYLYFAPHIQLPFRSILRSGIWGALFGLGISVPVDTFFWQSPTPLWPELTGFIYNFVEGKSKDWGTQPWHFYFTSALPRLFFNPVLYQVCIPFAIFTPIIYQPSMDILVPNLFFALIYSFLAHKEWRFIVYILPPLLAVASAGASWIWTRCSRRFYYRVLVLGITVSTLGSFAASAAMLFISRLNYPGAVALNHLHTLARNDTGVITVHLDTLSCTSGITHFLEQRPAILSIDKKPHEQNTLWVYDKTEGEDSLLNVAFWEKINYALTERPERVPGQWRVLDTVKAFTGVELAQDLNSTAPKEDDIIEALEALAQEVIPSIEDMWRKKSWDSQAADAILSKTQTFLMGYVTRGWWLKINMQPKIWILKKEKVDYSSATTEDVDTGTASTEASNEMKTPDFESEKAHEDQRNMYHRDEL